MCSFYAHACMARYLNNVIMTPTYQCRIVTCNLLSTSTLLLAPNASSPSLYNNRVPLNLSFRLITYSISVTPMQVYTYSDPHAGIHVQADVNQYIHARNKHEISDNVSPCMQNRSGTCLKFNCGKVRAHSNHIEVRMNAI